MARTKPPSFDFFPDDFIAGTYHLPAEAVGIYVRLLCYQWNNGSIPSDEAELARVAGVDADAMRTHMRTVMLKFMPDECGGLQNARLEREREHKLSVIEKSKAAADSRWAKEKARKEADSTKKPPCGRNADAYADAMRTHMPPTSNVQLPASECYMSLSLLKIKHFEFLSKNTACPEWLAPMFCRWLAFRTARDGHPVDEVLQDTWTANLIARGQDKALADIEFSINKQAKNLLHSENDFDKVAKAKIDGATKPAGKETAADKTRKMIEDMKNGLI